MGKPTLVEFWAACSNFAWSIDDYPFHGMGGVSVFGAASSTRLDV